MEKLLRIAIPAALLLVAGCVDPGDETQSQNNNDHNQTAGPNDLNIDQNNQNDDANSQNNDANNQNNDANDQNDDANDQNDDEQNDEECIPETDSELCDQAGLECGQATLNDQCDTERDVHCGDCPNDDCEDNQCVCIPLTCDDQDVQQTCGVVSDGCGGEILCDNDCKNPVGIGAYHTCVAEDDGGLRCWGRNDNGQLGVETDDTGNPVDSSADGVTVDDLADEQALQVFAGEQHTCTQLQDSSVYCWGDNSYMQLTDLAGDTSPTPVEMTNLDGEVSVIGTGGFHTCAAMVDNRMQCWGNNGDGQLGTGDDDWYEQPVETNVPDPDDFAIRKFDGGPQFSCYLNIDGDLFCWGKNTFGQIGNEGPEDSDDPEIYDEPMEVVVDVEKPLRDYSAGGTFIDGTGVGYTASGFTCAVDDTDTVKCWGFNGYGQLGMDPDAQDNNYSEYAEEIEGLVAPRQVAAGGEHACALEADGQIYCWGYNEYGQLGDGTTDDTYEPVLVEGLDDAAKLFAGTFHTCALLDDGDFKCWGHNDDGQLGDGTTENRTEPVSVFD